MTKELRIPLKYKEGCFSFSSINESSENFLLLTFGEYNDLSYNVPVGGNEVRLYNISYTPPEEYLYATYNSEGTLKYAEMIDGDDVRLVYIGYTDDDDARAEVTDFAEQSDACSSNTTGTPSLLTLQLRLLQNPRFGNFLKVSRRKNETHVLTLWS